MPHDSRVSDRQVGEIIDLFDGGRSMRSIAGELGLGYSVVRRILLDLGADPKKNATHRKGGPNFLTERLYTGEREPSGRRSRRKTEEDGGVGRPGSNPIHLTDDEVSRLDALIKGGASINTITAQMKIGHRRLTREMKRLGLTIDARADGRRNKNREHQHGLNGHPTDEQWSYTAGLFDARGRIVESENNIDTVSISLPFPSVALWMKATLGGGNVYHHQTRSEYRITNRAGVVQFARGVEPYLVAQRNRIKGVIADAEKEELARRGTADRVTREVEEILLLKTR